MIYIVSSYTCDGFGKVMCGLIGYYSGNVDVNQKYDGMLYGPIQGQGHVVLKVINSSIFKIYLVRHFQ